MKKEIRGFIRRAAALTLLLGSAGALIFTFLLKDYYFFLFPFVLIFFFLFTLGTHLWQVRHVKAGFSSFARSHMVVTFVRLFVFSAIIVLYLVFSRVNIISFTTVVVICYIAFTIFETTELTRYTSRKV